MILPGRGDADHQRGRSCIPKGLNTFQQYLVEEFVEDYQEGRLTRRQALNRIAAITGSMAAATAILAACAPPAQPAPTPTTAPQPTAPPAAPTPTAAQPTAAPTAAPTVAASPTAAPKPAGTPAAAPTVAVPPGVRVAANDPDLAEARDVSFPGRGGTTVLGYLAVPKGAGPFPAVLVCHENRGLLEHIKDVTRRLAKAGYVGLAVDLLSPDGGTERVPADQVPDRLGALSPDQMVQLFSDGIAYLRTLPSVRADRIGMTGFCFGGGVTWQVAIRVPDLDAAVPFYGPLPSPDQVGSIQAAILAIYAERDTRINSAIPPVEEALRANGKTFEKVIYPNTDHAFHNDTGPRYAPEAAQDAWRRTIAWFDRYLKG